MQQEPVCFKKGLENETRMLNTIQMCTETKTEIKSKDWMKNKTDDGIWERLNEIDRMRRKKRRQKKMYAETPSRQDSKVNIYSNGNRQWQAVVGIIHRKRDNFEKLH